MRKQGIIFLLLFIGLWSCREDVENVTATPQSFAPALFDDYNAKENIVISSVTGFVTNEAGEPLIEAQVNLNGSIAETDAFGHFFFIERPMNSEGTTVNISKVNFHQQSKLFYPHADAMEHLEIIMPAVKSNDDAPSGLGTGILNLHENIIVEYASNSFLKIDGTPYTGNVHIESSLVKSDTDDFFKKSLGNLQAANVENRLVGLIPEALLYFAFRNDNGESLSINENAETKMTIPMDHITEVSAAWYFAQDFGLYTPNTTFSIDPSGKTASLKLQHNVPILFGQSYPSEKTTLQLFAANGIDVLENVEVNIANEVGQNPTGAATLYGGYTNSHGVLEVIMPTDKPATLSVIDACNNVVYNETVESGNAILKLEQVTLATVTGDIYDCMVVPASNTTLAVVQGNQLQYHYVPNSSFNLMLQTCNNGLFNIQGLESSSGDANAGTAANYDLNAGAELGDIFTCEMPAINELRIENTGTAETFTYPITSAAISNTNELTSFRSTNNPPIDIRINFTGSSAGDYSAGIQHSINRIWDDESGFRYAGDAEIFIVTRFGNDNKIILGEFEGEFTNELTGQLDNIKGTFNFYEN